MKAQRNFNDDHWGFSLAQILLAAPVILFNAWALQCIWTWHITTTWGVAAPGLACGAVIISVVPWVVATSGNREKSTSFDNLASLIAKAFGGGLLLLMAWVLTW